MIQEKIYHVSFTVAVEAESPMEALEVAREAVLTGDAEERVNGREY